MHEPQLGALARPPELAFQPGEPVAVASECLGVDHAALGRF